MGCGSSAAAKSDTGIPPDAPKAYLPKNAPDKEHRKSELAGVRAVYDWGHHIPGLPPFVKEVPRLESDDSAHQHLTTVYKALAVGIVKGKFHKMVDWATEIFTTEKPLDDFHQVFDSAKNGNLGLHAEDQRDFVCPLVKDHWKEDWCFAWQRQNGLNPTLFRRVTSEPTGPNALPSNLAVTDELIAPVTGGVGLTQLINEKRLYIANYELLQSIPSPPERCLMAPIALLWVNQKKTLMPLCIQLTQHPGDGPVFLPTDPEWVWLAAKAHVQVADSVMHEVAAHLYATHLVCEATYVAMRRTMHESHPLHMMMKPHFWFTIHINVSARSNLIGGPDDAVPLLMAAGYEGTVAALLAISKDWSWDRFDLPKSIRRRGINDGDILPECYWRDDAQKLWMIIANYVAKMVDEFYATDADVKEDLELAAWIACLTAPEGPDGCGFKGMPLDDGGVIATKEKLCKFLTMTVFNASAGHSAVNNGQYDMMAYLPNNPATFKVPLDVLKSKPTSFGEKDFAAALHDGEKTVLQIAFVHTLSLPTEDPLGQFSNKWFGNMPKVHEIVKDFQADLKAMDDQIDARNSKLPPEKRYFYLKPAQVANGIAI